MIVSSVTARAAVLQLALVVALGLTACTGSVAPPQPPNAGTLVVHLWLTAGPESEPSHHFSEKIPMSAAVVVRRSDGRRVASAATDRTGMARFILSRGTYSARMAAPSQCGALATIARGRVHARHTTVVTILCEQP